MHGVGKNASERGQDMQEKEPLAWTGEGFVVWYGA
jgi:hypothetical protein